MAIAIERGTVMARRTRRHRTWQRLGHLFTYLGLFAALVFVWIQRVREARAAA